MASHQARAVGTWYIFTGQGLVACRRRPLSSTIKHQEPLRWTSGKYCNLEQIEKLA